jgi:hypothetical protein
LFSICCIIWTCCSPLFRNSVIVLSFAVAAASAVWGLCFM